MYRRGLTLFDIIVMALGTAVLAGLALSVTTHTHGRSGRTDCKNTLKQIGVYIQLYESKYHRYPEPGPNWFAALWQPGLAEDGDLFRCAVRGKSGSGCHYQGLMKRGTWTSTIGAPSAYTVPPEGLSDDATPNDLPVACDETTPWNHKGYDDINVLWFQGRVDIYSRDSTFFAAADAFLDPTGWWAPEGTR